jgi:hypothetical protein
MNFPSTPQELALYTEEPESLVVHQAELFLVEVVLPVVKVGFVFAAQGHGHRAFEMLAYRDAYARYRDDVAELATFCYAWSLEHLACRCRLVSLLEREGTATRIKLHPKFSLASMVLGHPL